jgi:hypothetical protein
MDFILLTPEQNYKISGSNRVKAHLKSGVVEILDGHQFLIGLIENNLIVAESLGDIKKEQFFVVQDAIFIVSDQSFESNNLKLPTTVYVYAKTFVELEKTTQRETFLKYYESKKQEFEQELAQKAKNNGDNVVELNLVLNSKALLLKEEVEFLQSVLFISEKIAQMA